MSIVSSVIGKMILASANYNCCSNYPIIFALHKVLCSFVSNHAMCRLETYHNTGDDRYCAEPNIIIKDIERELQGGAHKVNAPVLIQTTAKS